MQPLHPESFHANCRLQFSFRAFLGRLNPALAQKYKNPSIYAEHFYMAEHVGPVPLAMIMRQIIHYKKECLKDVIFPTIVRLHNFRAPSFRLSSR
jgi:hypothetical protein